jgi:ubiquitin C-terminal hydrolase
MVDSNGFSIASEKLELRDLLESHMQFETLDTDNMWECSGCCNRVQAVKYNEYMSLPPSLMIHLNRLRYNTVS